MLPERLLLQAGILTRSADSFERACAGVRSLRRLAGLKAWSHLAQQDVRPCCVVRWTRSQSNHRRDSPLGIWIWLLLPERRYLRPDQCQPKRLQRRLYAGDPFPMLAALKGIHLDDIRKYEHFAADLQGAFHYNYVFIEPSYCLLNDYKGSTSEYPPDNVRLGEGLIKATYEAIRNSPIWNTSILIITWDEHGGFYDHVTPPAAVAPGDTSPSAGHNKNGFTFEQYGPRVPAVVISPWIPKNVVDHRRMIILRFQRLSRSYLAWTP